MLEIFQKLSQDCSKLTTEKYSTSFGSAIKLLHKDFQAPVYNIYGFVRLADEVVDTFVDFNRKTLLENLKQETFCAIEQRISTNMILNSFQLTVNKYGIDHALVNAFFGSMESDLIRSRYDDHEYKKYIYGSAEVVGLMCLYIFCEGNETNFNKLKPSAQALGAAFQKVNFLRDLRVDVNQLQRSYFPGADVRNFTTKTKLAIEQEILSDFQEAYKGIQLLPVKARFGVLLAYNYYYSLFKKIKKTTPASLMITRIRIPNYLKLLILLRTGFKNQLHLF